MKIHTTRQWLNTLSDTLENVHCKSCGKSETFENSTTQMMDLLQAAQKEQAAVWWVGNGGSAAICSHLSQDVMNKLKIKSFYLGDTALITCMANDFGYEQVYARPLENMVSKGDLLIAISSSGNSENIVSCVSLAKEKGMKVITLSGMDTSNRLWNSAADLSFFVSSSLYGIVETSHEAILHGVIETLWIQQ